MSIRSLERYLQAYEQGGFEALKPKLRFEERYPRLENCLQKAVLKHGVPRILYVDNGSVYNAKQLAIVCARMGTKLLHAKPYSPESKGKI